LKLYDLAVIQPLLEKHGFHFSKSMGQNFLVQEWVPKKIVQVSGVNKEFGVMEIGPGVGVLTQELCMSSAKVISVELDRALLPVLNESLAVFSNAEIINGDILKIPLSEILEERFDGLRVMACANLPYNITTPVLRKLLELEVFERITVMIQKEVAERICAKPGTPEYGAFSVFCAYYSSPSICFDVSPDCFYPKPKVTSTVITLDRIKRDYSSDDREFLFSVSRAAFSQRRKTLVNALSSMFSGKLDKAGITECVVTCGFDERIRGETLSLDDFMNLSATLKSKIN